MNTEKPMNTYDVSMDTDKPMEPNYVSMDAENLWVLKLMKNLTIPIRVALIAFRVNDPLVEDKPVAFLLFY